MKKRCHRRVVTPQLPRGLRPKLSRTQLQDLELVHLVNVDAIARGEADETILWHVVGGVLTWSRVAGMLGTGVDEMTVQLEMVMHLVERYRDTGRVLFRGPEYQVAKEGVQVMQQLAHQVDQHIAEAAATWAEMRVQALAE